MVSLQLELTKDGGTLLVLTHRGVPKDLIPEVEAYWKNKYWNEIKKL